MPNPKEKAPLGSTPKPQTSLENPVQSPSPTSRKAASATAVSSSDIAANRSSVQRDPQQGNVATRTPTYEEIQLAAYQLYLERGSLDGFADEDWLQAERELIEGREAQRKARATGA